MFDEYDKEYVYCDECACEIRQPDEIGKEFDVLEYAPGCKRRKRVKHYLCIDCIDG
jgi:hypothetical protein